MDDTIKSTSSMKEEFQEEISIQKIGSDPCNNSVELKQLINLISNKAFSGLSSSVCEQRPILDSPNLLRPFIPEAKKKEPKIENKHPTSLSKTPRQKFIKTTQKPFIYSESTFDKKILAPEDLSLKKEMPFVNQDSEEQLSDLRSILEKNTPELSKEMAKQIYHLAELISISPDKDKVHTLGKLIYLSSYLPNNELKLAKTKSCEHLTKWIHLKFQEKIQFQWEDLQKLKKSIPFSPLKPASTVLRHRYTIFLVEFLISKNGTINFGLINPFLQLCPPEKVIHLSSGDPLLSTLRMIQEDHSFRKQFASLELPNQMNTGATAIIRAALSIETSQKIGPLEAKKTILSALLSNLRQGSDGSCFAMPLTIFLLKKHPILCLDDFSSLLKKNCLRRKFNQTARDFPFILNNKTTDLEKLPSIDSEGCFSESKNGKLKAHQDPIILSLCQFLGITAPKQTISQIIYENRVEFQKGVPLTIFIQKLILEAKKLPKHAQNGIGELYHQSLLMLQAQTMHPLLAAWTNSIANMAEPDETGMVRSTIIRAILHTFKNELQEVLSSSEKLEVVLKAAKEILSSHIQLQYDPTIQMQEKSSDQRSSSGAFVMYDTHDSQETGQWTRIDNPKAFVLFISNLFDTEENQNSELKSFWKYLHKYTLTEKFLKKCLCEYYHKNVSFTHPLKEHQHISYSPWITKSGNSFSKVIQVYFENFVSSNSEIVSIENGKDLILKLSSIEKAVKKSEGEQNNLIPVRIPKVHAFNLLLSHPSIMPFLKAKKKEEWIDKHLLVPCKLLSEETVDMECYNTFFFQIKKEMVPKEMRSQLDNILLTPPYKPMKIRELREFALVSLNELFRKKKVIQGELKSQLDILLIDILPKKYQTEIYSKAIHFADTNWSDGVHDIHFCLIMNPGKGELDVVACYDDGEKFFPLNEDLWIHGKKWEFFMEIDLSAKQSLEKKK